MTWHIQTFTSPQLLVKFMNDNSLTTTQVKYLYFDAASGHHVLVWYA